MANIENESWQGKFVIRSDGKRYFDTTGRHHTQAEKDKIKKNRRIKLGRAIPHSRETLEKVSNVWRIARPLVLRGATASEIPGISGLTYSQARNSIFRKRARQYSAPDSYSSDEQIKARRKKTHLGKAKKIEDRRLSRHEHNSVEFAMELFGAGLITDDLSVWQRLCSILGEARMITEEPISYGIVLEVFTLARVKANEGNRGLLESYVSRGLAIDEEWFKSGKLTQDRRLILKGLDRPKS